MKRKTYTRNNTPLNNRRVELGISLSELAKSVGVKHEQYMSNWFNGTRCPSDAYIGNLADALNVSVDWIRDCYESKPTHCNRSRIDNFWINKRKDANLTMKDVCEILNIKKDKSTVAKYFTGEILPTDDVINSLCQIFDVDFATGKHEFEKAYDVWHEKKKSDNAHKANCPAAPKNETTASDDMKNLPDYVAVSPKKLNAICTPNDIGKAIYDKVSYEEFCTIMTMIDTNTALDDLPKMIYRKVDYDTFNSILEAIS